MIVNGIKYDIERMKHVGEIIVRYFGANINYDLVKGQYEFFLHKGHPHVMLGGKLDKMRTFHEVGHCLSWLGQDKHWHDLMTNEIIAQSYAFWSLTYFDPDQMFTSIDQGVEWFMERKNIYIKKYSHPDFSCYKLFPDGDQIEITDVDDALYWMQEHPINQKLLRVLG